MNSRNSNLMFHVKHTAAALLLGAVLVAPTASHASGKADAAVCLAVADGIGIIADARDKGVPQLKVDDAIDSTTTGVGNLSLHRAATLLYQHPSLTREEAMGAFLKGCLGAGKSV